MDNKLSELSKPVGFVSKLEQTFLKCGETASIRPFFDVQGSSPLYSQEYVSALLAEMDSLKRLVELIDENWENDISNLLDARQRIAEFEQKEHHSERQSVIDGLARSGEAWADIEEYMEKWDAEHRKTMMEQPVRYQCREIGEGGWKDCDKDRYDYCQRRPEMDTRIVSSPMAWLEFEKQNNSGVAGMVEDYETKLKAKDERICELEAIATEYAGKFQKAQDANKHLVIMSNDDKKRIAELERANTSQDDHINQQQDRIDSLEKTNTGLGRRLGDAEKRLATPVRLPNKNDDEFWFGGVFQVARFDRAVERAIRAAGFKFVGDE